ncbi:hypothetical protein Trydic_g3246 [Trypoxylus dichotomus]
MNTVLFIAICWISIAPAKGLGVMKPMMKASREEFYPAVTEVGSNGKTYNGMYVNGRAVATDTEVNSDDIQVCGFIRVPCTHITEKMLIVDDVGYLTFPWYPNFTRLTQDMVHRMLPSNPKECVAVAATHDPVLVTIRGQKAECSGCQHMDTLVCDYQVVGVIFRDGRILEWTKMIEVVEKYIGRDDESEFLKTFEKRGGMGTAMVRSGGGGNSTSGVDTYSFYKHMVFITVFAALF